MLSSKGTENSWIFYREFISYGTSYKYSVDIAVRKWLEFIYHKVGGGDCSHPDAFVLYRETSLSISQFRRKAPKPKSSSDTHDSHVQDNEVIETRAPPALASNYK